MKKSCTILLLLFILVACKKQSTTDILSGSWKLTQVYNDSLHDSIPRPLDAAGNFIITFQSAKAFAGQSFRNAFFDGSYTLSNLNQLRFGPYDATKITEDAWGSKFNGFLMSCMLQSVSPCTPLIISINNDKLKITSFYHDILLFEKM